MSLLVRPCVDCGKTLDPKYTKARKYCAECKDKKSLEHNNRMNHAKKTRLIYGRMFTNLTKNYVYFVEGLKN